MNFLEILKKDLTNCLIAASNSIVQAENGSAQNGSIEHGELSIDRDELYDEEQALVKKFTKGRFNLTNSLDLLDDGIEDKNCRQLLIALSGGPDSTALLIALSELAFAFNFKIMACHINHGLRGQESEADALFCRQLCQRLKVECEIISLKLGHIEQDLGMGENNSNMSENTISESSVRERKKHFSEDNLRQKRYECLGKFAAAQNIAFILTAHTLDDQIETIMFRLLRGTALTGLRGIETCRQLDKQLYLLRPLLGVTKEQCRLFLESRGIVACNDSSNLNEIYNRNYIRHKILPPIKQRFPHFVQHLDSLRQVISAEDTLLDEMTRQLVNKLEAAQPNKWSIELLNQQPLALRRRAIAMALTERNIPLSFARIEEILALRQQTLNLNGYWRVKCNLNQLIWQQIPQFGKNVLPDEFQSIAVEIPGINAVASLEMAARRGIE